MERRRNRRGPNGSRDTSHGSRLEATAKYTNHAKRDEWAGRRLRRATRGQPPDTAENANESAHTEARSHKVKTDPRMAEYEMCRSDTIPCGRLLLQDRVAATRPPCRWSSSRETPQTNAGKRQTHRTPSRSPQARFNACPRSPSLKRNRVPDPGPFDPGPLPVP